MKMRNERLEKGLTSIDPLGGEDLHQLASESGAEELLAAILASSRDDTSKPKRIARRRSTLRARRSRLAIAVPVATAALVVSIVGIPGGQNGPATLPALAKAAEAAAAQPPPNADLPYVYTKTQDIYTDTSVAGGQSWSVYAPSTQERWIAKDGSGRIRRVWEAPKWVSPKDKEAWEAAGSIKFTDWSARTEEEDVPAGHFGQLFGGTKLSELPTDPTELAAWLEDRVTNPKANAGAGNGFSAAVRTLTLTSEILGDPLASPELRAALYEAEGLVPGIESFGKATDAIGRHGFAIGAESANSGARYTLIFDPETSQVLATEQTRLNPRTHPGQTLPTEGTMFLDSGMTSSLTKKP